MLRWSFASLAIATVAAGAQARNFGEAGGYEVVAIESTSEKGGDGACVMAEDDFEGPGSTRLRLFRYLENPDLIWVTVSNYNWTAKKDQQYQLRYEFDEVEYEREAFGIEDSIHKGFAAGFPYTDFMKHMARSSRLHIYMGDTLVDKLSMDGSAAGAALFSRCWTYLQADERAKARERARWQDIPKDPFAKPKQESEK